MNLGRNDPCHCGSGKKYKKCCLEDTLPNQDDFKLRRWSVIQKKLTDKLITHSKEIYGPDVFDQAFEEFHFYKEEFEFNPDYPELLIFMSWFFYEWYPDNLENPLIDLPEVPPAQSLLNSSQVLSDDERSYLIECCQTSISFFEIIEINPNISMKLKNILTEEVHFVLEKDATQGAQLDEILFGKVISIDDIEILEAYSSLVIDPQFKLTILELRNHLQKRNKIITQKVLHNYNLEVLQTYHDIYNTIVDPPPPVITNTDGHLMIPHKMIFEIESPIDTFTALHKLNFNLSKEELLQQENVLFDSSGNLIAIEFAWLKKGNKVNKGWKNTVLGRIFIDGIKMTVEVNSKERAKKFQSEIKKRMASGWKLKTTLIESIESQLEKAGESDYENSDIESEHDELMKIPEIHQQMENMMKAHWDNWIKSSIPALGGLTPLNAMKTKNGREMLEALLNQLERDVAQNPMVGQTVETIKMVRAKLGL